MRPRNQASSRAAELVITPTGAGWLLPRPFDPPGGPPSSAFESAPAVGPPGAPGAGRPATGQAEQRALLLYLAAAGVRCVGLEGMSAADLPARLRWLDLAADVPQVAL